MNPDHAPLRVEREGPVTRLTLDRPERGNALDAALVDALSAAVDAAAADGTRLLVLQGQGPGFCTGFDFTGIEAQSDGDLALRFLRIEALLQAVAHAPFATLALAHGRVFGAGADLVCCCTHRYADPGTRFRMPGLLFGVVLGTRRFAERVGGAAARRILLEARPFDAAEAGAIGFLDGTAAPEAWPALVERTAAAARTLAPDAARTVLELTARDSRAADLAALARSVAGPGLKERMLAYRAGGAPRPAAAQGG